MVPRDTHRMLIRRWPQNMSMQIVLELRHDGADLRLSRISLWVDGSVYCQRPARPRPSFRPGHAYLFHYWNHPGATERWVLSRSPWSRDCLDERSFEWAAPSSALSATSTSNPSSTAGSASSAGASDTTHPIPWVVQLHLDHFPPRDRLDREVVSVEERKYVGARS